MHTWQIYAVPKTFATQNDDAHACKYSWMNVYVAPHNAPFLGVWALITDLGQVTVRAKAARQIYIC